MIVTGGGGGREEFGRRMGNNAGEAVGEGDGEEGQIPEGERMRWG
jgi:hypothetical protein